jgi:hypothetical protein
MFCCESGFGSALDQDSVTLWIRNCILIEQKCWIRIRIEVNPNPQPTFLTLFFFIIQRHLGL